jgi:hypothetical protein
VPRSADDTRTNAQRRVDAFTELLTSVLGHGLPADNGISPHINVIVDAQTLKHTLNGNAPEKQELDLGREPAILEGFGPSVRRC